MAEGILPGQSLEGDPLLWRYALAADAETAPGTPVTSAMLRQLFINIELVKKTAEGAGGMKIIKIFDTAGTFSVDLTEKGSPPLLKLTVPPSVAATFVIAGYGTFGSNGRSNTYSGLSSKVALTDTSVTRVPETKIIIPVSLMDNVNPTSFLDGWSLNSLSYLYAGSWTNKNYIQKTMAENENFSCAFLLDTAGVSALSVTVSGTLTARPSLTAV